MSFSPLDPLYPALHVAISGSTRTGRGKGVKVLMMHASNPLFSYIIYGQMIVKCRPVARLQIG